MVSASQPIKARDLCTQGEGTCSAARVWEGEEAGPTWEGGGGGEPAESELETTWSELGDAGKETELSQGSEPQGKVGSGTWFGEESIYR